MKTEKTFARLKYEIFSILSYFSDLSLIDYYLSIRWISGRKCVEEWKQKWKSASELLFLLFYHEKIINAFQCSMNILINKTMVFEMLKI